MPHSARMAIKKERFRSSLIIFLFSTSILFGHYINIKFRPDIINTLFYGFIHNDRFAPFARGFAGPLVGGIKADLGTAMKAGLRGTPTFLMRGEKYIGRIPEATLNKLLEESVTGPRISQKETQMK